MAIYVSNEMGDWWQADSSLTLWVLDTAQLSEEGLAALQQAEEGGFDKFDTEIREYGKPITINL